MSKREKVIVPKALLPAGIFPHNIRFFSAETGHHIFMVSGKALLWISIVTLTLINLSVMRPSLASSLSDRFPVAGELTKLTALIGKLTGSSVLGVSDLNRQLREERGAKERDLAYWQQVVLTHPDYRDAYIQLITLSYELGDTKDISRYADKLRELDPNEVFVQKLPGLFAQQ